MCTSELPNLDVRFEINDCFNEVLSLYTREIFLSIKILKGLKHKKTQVVTFFFFSDGIIHTVLCWKCSDMPQILKKLVAEPNSFC